LVAPLSVRSQVLGVITKIQKAIGLLNYGNSSKTLTPGNPEDSG